jgi:hypothetical protein
MKINRTLPQNTWFLWTCISSDEDRNIPSCANKQKTLTMLSPTAGNTSSTHCSTIRSTLVEGERRLIFVTLELIPHTGCFVGYEAGGLQQSY